jgi:ATP-dependent DNA ligase
MAQPQNSNAHARFCTVDYDGARAQDQSDIHRADLLLPAPTLPEGANWAYELKLNGYRKTDGKVHLRSRNNKDFNARYPAVAEALAPLPNETVIGGEVVALDESGRPFFNIL